MNAKYKFYEENLEKFSLKYGIFFKQYLNFTKVNYAEINFALNILNKW